MGDPIEEERANESLDRLRTELSSMLDCGEDGIDFQLFDINTEDVDIYLHKIYIDQDLPQKLLKISYKQIHEKSTYDNICEYCQAKDVQFPPLFQQRVYFVETADSAATIIPIQLNGDMVNIRIELLENSPEFIKDMYMKIGKLKMQDIKFVKFNKQ